MSEYKVAKNQSSKGKRFKLLNDARKLRSKLGKEYKVYFGSDILNKWYDITDINMSVGQNGGVFSIPRKLKNKK